MMQILALAVVQQVATRFYPSSVVHYLRPSGLLHHVSNSYVSRPTNATATAVQSLQSLPPTYLSSSHGLALKTACQLRPQHALRPDLRHPFLRRVLRALKASNAHGLSESHVTGSFKPRQSSSPTGCRASCLRTTFALPLATPRRRARWKTSGHRCQGPCRRVLSAHRKCARTTQTCSPRRRTVECVSWLVKV